jgi:hypothetical protein
VTQDWLQLRLKAKRKFTIHHLPFVIWRRAAVQSPTFRLPAEEQAKAWTLNRLSVAQSSKVQVQNSQQNLSSYLLVLETNALF